MNSPQYVNIELALVDKNCSCDANYMIHDISLEMDEL